MTARENIVARAKARKRAGREVYFHRHCAVVADGSEPDFTSDVPLFPVMFAICDRGFGEIRCDQGWMDGNKADNALPSMGRAGL